MGITRRVFGTGLLGLGVGLGIGFGIRALAERPTAARLAEALNRRLGSNPFHARFEVPSFAMTEAGGTRMAAHVRLDWAAGLRTRDVIGEGADADAAWAALLDAAVAEFGATVPGFHRGTAAA